MLVTGFSTEDVAAEDRFERWLDFTSQSVKRVARPEDRAEDFRASLRVVDLGDVGVAAVSGSSVRAARTPKNIRQSDPEAYLVELVLSGNGVLSHAGRESVFGAGDVVISDTSRPFHMWRSCSPDTTASVVVQVSHAMMPLPSSTAASLLAVPISTRGGLAALFSRWLTDITKRAGDFTSADAPALSSVVVDLLAAMLSRQTGSVVATTPESRRHVLCFQIREFIQHRLDDPALSPKVVAAAHRISLRHLHKVFEEQGTTVAAWIRRCRLERCRRDLANPLLGSHPVHAIASRWGFADAAHFSRVFRTAYGMSPTEYRHSVLRLPTSPSAPTGDAAGRRL
ncbi:helix-turn-helix domain-containing protein [Streptomyces sp. SAJ15]|uniref:helix-turn-helix domain-containing protein n=1 Tax=Streptomyces sp. SAJ15 TaxID=2011095 RepID=UPI001185F810|nr:helix-turn-helix domain-containing protein [Streptomyces sp. SAJ15]TVL91256.1 AraC family transcriptional regulator [Streptomyces sp. SAJ15]